MPALEPRDIALMAAEAALEKKAEDVVVLDVAETLVITGYFVVATGASDRQVKAIAEEVERVLREHASLKPIGREGEREAKWVLLDFADVVVHVFQPDEREFYRLERLWSDAPRIEVGEAGAVQAAADDAAPEGPAHGQTDAS